MNIERVKRLIKQKENIRLEFKEAGTALPGNLFETICAMLNRDGGDIVLGVQDDGTIKGVNESSISTMVTNLVNLSNNSQKLDPPFILYPQTYELKGKFLIHIQVPASSQVHKTASVVFDRSHDGDFRVTAPHQIAEIYNRKRNHYTEGIIYPAVRLEDFNSLLFAKVRNLIKSNNAGHPWLTLDDEQLLQKAGLWKRDYLSGQEGYTLAAVLLFGKDEVIQQVVPHYKTDALVRIQDKLRYDDREYIQTNLIDAYERLMAFVAKHLPDRFYLEDGQRISLRTTLFREIIANIIAHREYTNAQPATFIIKSDVIETENANNPHGSGPISPDSFTPFPKNPTIAKFMMQLGWVEELGSGILNVNKYWQAYGKTVKPQFIEGATFKIVLPVSDTFFTGNEDGNQDSNQDGNYDERDYPYRFRGNIYEKEGFSQWMTILHELFEPLIQAQYFDLYRDMLAQFPAEWKKLLEFCLRPKTRKEILEEALGVSNQTKNFRTNVLLLLEYGLLKRTQPDKPQSKNQKYITTHDGEKLLRLLNDL
jgi:ATP-dependent DNA helicase RecG